MGRTAISLCRYVALWRRLRHIVDPEVCCRHLSSRRRVASGCPDRAPAPPPPSPIPNVAPNANDDDDDDSRATPAWDGLSGPPRPRRRDGVSSRQKDHLASEPLSRWNGVAQDGTA